MNELDGSEETVLEMCQTLRKISVETAMPVTEK
jgi:hypothetical protein